MPYRFSDHNSPRIPVLLSCPQRYPRRPVSFLLLSLLLHHSVCASVCRAATRVSAIVIW
jgi:hypothetical protein